jgi:ribonuclease HII
VCVPRDWVGPKGLTDSKKLTEARREALFELLMKDPQVRVQTQFMYPFEIDARGVYRANIHLHLLVHGTNTEILHVADGNLDLGPDIVSLPKADTLVPAVSAASIIAKVRRDREMVGYDRTYPGYDFAGSKGYGVPKHQAGLSLLGPCKIHRMSYAPVAAAVQRQAVIEQDDAMALMDELPQE